ncbi:MAG TPA: sigma-70 family RNA polymerase sigma factor, partial [Candidatus Baltobacteraceae bacterium]|nr:sigma-70 family RNA polymerase sigma factor [Candidatus Baltobacteraceae bacterium]
MDADDESLVADFIARRSAGLEGAYRRYGIELVSVARHVLGRHADAEDCVHDALLRVWRAPDSFRPERGSLRAFLIVCVRNEAMSRLRSAGRRSEREKKAFRLEVVPEGAAEVVDHVEAARVRDALARLPEEQRVALERAFFGNLSQREVAESLGVPLGTIKSRIALGMRKLS